VSSYGVSHGSATLCQSVFRFMDLRFVQKSASANPLTQKGIDSVHSIVIFFSEYELRGIDYKLIRSTKWSRWVF